MEPVGVIARPAGRQREVRKVTIGRTIVAVTMSTTPSAIAGRQR